VPIMKRPFALKSVLFALAVTLSVSGCSATSSATATPAPSALPTTALAGILYGLNYSPYIHAGQSPSLGTVLDEKQVDDTLTLVAPCTQWVKTFGCTGNLAGVGAKAHDRGLKVALGAWLGSDLSANDAEIDSLIQAARAGQADALIVGSETLLRGDLTEAQLLGYIEKVKKAVKGIPVTTADTAAALLQHPKVLSAVDCVFANFYPFWDGVSVTGAVGSLADAYAELKTAAGGRQVIVGETGWPDAGPAVKDAVPSPENAARYLLDFCRWANGNGVPYFLFEAFDEPWKATPATPQEAHWGLWDESGLKPLIAGAHLPDAIGIPQIAAIIPAPSPSPSPSLPVSPTPTQKPTPAPTKALPDLSVTKITERFGAYGGMDIKDYKNSGCFTMVLGSGSWASVGIDVDKEGKNSDLSGYRYAIIHAKGLKGGEQFRFGLGVGPTDFYFRDGLTKDWQDVVIDISASRRDLTDIFQVGFEIGPSWTNNATGTTIMINGIRFSNSLPEGKYSLVAKEG
jgi:glucan 1,3-beta-glucosidase